MVGGRTMTTRRGRFEESAMRIILFFTATVAVATVALIVAFLLIQAEPAFSKIGLVQLLLGRKWIPTGFPPRFGALPIIAGTILVTIGAMAVSAPLGVACALFLTKVAPTRVRMLLRPGVELLAAIPSVVYGFFGLTATARWIKSIFGLSTGETWLNGSILLGVMALPTIVAISAEAIASVPREFEEASLALGANRWQTLRSVVLPSAISGISAAIILGLGRAIGETMAVMMATGNAAVIPRPLWNIFSPIRTITGTLGTEMGEAPLGSIHYHALFALAVVLFVMVVMVNSAAAWILRRIRKRQYGSTSSLPDRSSPPRVLVGFHTIQRRIVSFALLLTLLLLGYILAGVMGALVVPSLYLVLRRITLRLDPKTSQRVAFAGLWLAGAIALLALGTLVTFIAIKGLPAISWSFLSEAPRDNGRAGGIFPAIIGTLLLVAGAIAFALPLGLGAAIYLSEFSHEGRVTRLIRSGIDALNGTPSVVFGMFGMALFVLYLGFGRSLLAGQLTLGLMILPTIIRASEEGLRSVPLSMREGSLALGATRWQTVSRVVLPPALPAVLTGAILAVGRAAGETAPIMFTAAVFLSRHLPTGPFDPVMALPYHLYSLVVGVPNAETNAYGTALVLLGLVMLINLSAVLLRNKFQEERI